MEAVYYFTTDAAKHVTGFILPMDGGNAFFFKLDTVFKAQFYSKFGFG